MTKDNTPADGQDDTPIPGLITLTPELLAQMSAALKERHADIAARYPALVDACPYEMKLAVVAWAMRQIVEHAGDGGSYRHLIYGRLGFGPDAYVPLYDAGGMTISNDFVIAAADPADAKLAKDLRHALAPAPDSAEPRMVSFEGGQEPWSSVCAVTFRLEDLSAALVAEPEKRARAIAQAVEDERQRCAELVRQHMVRNPEALKCLEQQEASIAAADPMTMERAESIVGRLVEAYLSTCQAHDRGMPDLCDVSLGDALTANRMILNRPPGHAPAQQGDVYLVGMEPSQVPRVLAAALLAPRKEWGGS